MDKSVFNNGKFNMSNGYTNHINKEIFVTRTNDSQGLLIHEL